MFCTECGKEIPDGSAFCTECGAKLTQAGPPPAAVPPPPAATPGQVPPPAQPVVPVTKPKSNKTLIGVILGIVGLLVVVAVVLVLVFVVFKGNDTAKAKEYMKKGDEKRQSVAKEATAVGDSIDKLFSDLKAGTITTSQDFNSRAETIKSDISDVKSGTEEARSDFEKIKDLNDVEDYKKYATLRIESTDAATEIMKAEEEFLNYTAEFLASIEAGTATDMSTYEQKANEYGQNISDLIDKGSSASTKAEALKKEKNL
jgi:flagellar basal body-associated protein FliL